MKQILPSVPVRASRVAAPALGLWFGLALAACSLAAADTTNAPVPAPPEVSPPKLVVPPEWKVDAPAHDYVFDGLTLSEVARSLSDQTKNQFDVLMPGVIALQEAPAGTGLPVEQIDPGGIPMKLRLKNVSIVEAFQAMNMLFEIDHTPVRWELVMNGHRPVAVLRGVLEPKSPLAVPSVGHSVAYVGNLLGTPDLGRMSPDALCETLETTAEQTFPGSNTIKIKFHRGAELVVLSGTDEELRLMNEVLQALKDKVSDRRKPGAPADQPAPPGK